MKKSQIFGIIIAIALIVFSAAYPVPEKHIRVSSFAYDDTWRENRGDEYVGGDAYNFQMEASLKAGYMSGVLAMKAITFVGGVLLFFLTLYSRVKCACVEEQTKMLDALFGKTEEQTRVLDKISEKFEKCSSVTGTTDHEDETSI